MQISTPNPKKLIIQNFISQIFPPRIYLDNITTRAQKFSNLYEICKKNMKSTKYVANGMCIESLQMHWVSRMVSISLEVVRDLSNDLLYMSEQLEAINEGHSSEFFLIKKICYKYFMLVFVI